MRDAPWYCKSRCTNGATSFSTNAGTLDRYLNEMRKNHQCNRTRHQGKVRVEVKHTARKIRSSLPTNHPQGGPTLVGRRWDSAGVLLFMETWKPCRSCNLAVGYLLITGASFQSHGSEGERTGWGTKRLLASLWIASSWLQHWKYVRWWKIFCPVAVSFNWSFSRSSPWVMNFGVMTNRALSHVQATNYENRKTWMANHSSAQARMESWWLQPRESGPGTD